MARDDLLMTRGGAADVQMRKADAGHVWVPMEGEQLRTRAGLLQRIGVPNRLHAHAFVGAGATILDEPVVLGGAQRDWRRTTQRDRLVPLENQRQ